MTTLAAEIELRHACEKAVEKIAEIAEVTTDHEREITEFTVHYRDRKFVISFRKIEE